MPEAPVRSRRSWAAALGEDRAAAAVEIARDVAIRASDPERIRQAQAMAQRQTSYPRSVYWEPYAIAQGDAGLALLFACLDATFPGEGWDVVAHQVLSVAVSGAERSPPPPAGLFQGLSGLAFAAWSLSRDGSRYGRLLETLDQAVVPQTVALAGAVERQGSGLSVGAFDVISGLAGAGSYLLCRSGEPGPAYGLNVALRALVSLTREIDDVPRWYTPPSMLADEAMVRAYPNGNLNCGLAHGIPGPLALLALARREGVTVEGQDDAMARIANWLIQHRADDAWGVNWPTAIPVPARGEGMAGGEPSGDTLEPSRSAWCYGSPGVARALWLAGDAVRESSWRELAVDAMAAVFRRPVRERGIDSPTFCHGVAGLLQIALRFARDTQLPLLGEGVRALSDQLLEMNEPASLLGYRSFEPSGARVDQPGLLDGAPGVAMVLLAAAADVDPAWDRLFLLS